MNRRSPARRPDVVGAPVERARARRRRARRAVDSSWTNVVVGERVDDIGMAVQREAEHPRRAEDPARALGRDRCLAETAGDRRRPRVALAQPPQLQQPEVGIGCRREPAEDRREELLHDARVGA